MSGSSKAINSRLGDGDERDNNQVVTKSIMFVSQAAAASLLDEINRAQVNGENNPNARPRIKFSRVALGTINNIVKNRANNLAKQGLLGDSCPCPFHCAFWPFVSSCSQCNCGYD